MTLRIGTHSVQVATAPSGCLLVYIDGRLLQNRGFMFAKDAFSAAEKILKEEVRR